MERRKVEGLIQKEHRDAVSNHFIILDSKCGLSIPCPNEIVDPSTGYRGLTDNTGNTILLPPVFTKITFNGDAYRLHFHCEWNFGIERFTYEEFNGNIYHVGSEPCDNPSGYDEKTTCILTLPERDRIISIPSSVSERDDGSYGFNKNESVSELEHELLVGDIIARMNIHPLSNRSPFGKFNQPSFQDYSNNDHKVNCPQGEDNETELPWFQQALKAQSETVDIDGISSTIHDRLSKIMSRAVRTLILHSVDGKDGTPSRIDTASVMGVMWGIVNKLQDEIVLIDNMRNTTEKYSPVYDMISMNVISASMSEPADIAELVELTDLCEDEWDGFKRFRAEEQLDN